MFHFLENSCDICIIILEEKFINNFNVMCGVNSIQEDSASAIIRSNSSWLRRKYQSKYSQKIYVTVTVFTSHHPTLTSMLC